jgi:predicted HTH domain antitoxin
MAVNVKFPEELLVASREDRDSFARKVVIYTLGHLYEQGKISSGIGAQVLECDRLEFYRLLSEHGFSVIDYEEDELGRESRTSRKIAEEVKNKK